MDSVTTSLTADQIKEEFAVRRKRQLLLLIPVAFFFGFAILVGGGFVHVPVDLNLATTKIAFFLVVAACVGFSWWNWRCPACKGYLGRGIEPRHCRNCGVELR
jgi:hypothetical protein